MSLKYVAIVLALGSTQANAGTVYVPVPTPMGATCLWQVPGVLKWLNLQRLTDINVNKNTNGPGWITTLSFGHYEGDYRVTSSSDDAYFMVNTIKGRLQECAAGK